VQLIKQFVAWACNAIAPSAWITYSLVTQNHNLEPELWLVPKLLSFDGVAVDVGANAGIWSLQFARFTRHVHAFEPNPICLRQLSRTLPAYVNVHPVGLSDTSGFENLRFDIDNTGIGTIESANKLNQNPGIKNITSKKIKIDRLDSYALSDVKIIKIDVEGHEEAVLRGAWETLCRDRPAVIVEIEERHNPGGISRIRSIFDKLNYSALVIDNGRLRSLEIVEVEDPGRIAKASGIYNFVFLDGSQRSLLCRDQIRTAPVWC
jgi:FkbM family methyltransferase